VLVPACFVGLVELTVNHQIVVCAAVTAGASEETPDKRENARADLKVPR
jgi:hypothetical protein